MQRPMGAFPKNQPRLGVNVRPMLAARVIDFFGDTLTVGPQPILQLHVGNCLSFDGLRAKVFHFMLGMIAGEPHVKLLKP